MPFVNAARRQVMAVRISGDARARQKYVEIGLVGRDPTAILRCGERDSTPVSTSRSSEQLERRDLVMATLWPACSGGVATPPGFHRRVSEATGLVRGAVCGCVVETRVTGARR